MGTGLKCRFCGVVLSACLCFATIGHAAEHPETQRINWPAQGKVIATTSGTSTASVAPAGWWRQYFKPPGK